MERINLADLIGQKELQKIIESFESAFNMSAAITDIHGKLLTSPKKISELCGKVIRNTEAGEIACQRSDAIGGLKAIKAGKPSIYTCKGYGKNIDFAVPVFVKGEPIGFMLGGQVNTKLPAEKECKARAMQYGLDPKKFWRAAVTIFMFLCIIEANLPVSLAAPGWAGSFYSSPYGSMIGTGTVFYDTLSGRIKKCIDVSGLKWEDFPIGCAYTKFSIVALDGKADFTVKQFGDLAIQKAIDSLSISSEENRCAVILLAGEYYIGDSTIKCRQYVDIIGIDRQLCRITGNGTVISAVGNSGIINLSLESKKGVFPVIIFNGKGRKQYVDSVSVKGHGDGIRVKGKSLLLINGCEIVSEGACGIKSYQGSDTGIFNSKVFGAVTGVDCFQKSFVFMDMVIASCVSMKGASILEVKSRVGGRIKVDGSLRSEVRAVSVEDIEPVDKNQKIIIKEPKDMQEDKYYCVCRKNTGEIESISVKEVRNILNDKKIILIDVRDRISYKNEHIKKAVSMPYGEISEKFNEIPRFSKVIVYCIGNGCNQSESAAHLLISLGVSNVKNMKEGLEGWKKFKYPVEKKSGKKEEPYRY